MSIPARGVWVLGAQQNGRGNVGPGSTPEVLGAGFRLTEGGDARLLEQGTDKRLLEP